MSIRDRVKRQLGEIVASALGAEDVTDRVDEILSIPEIAVVDRSALLTEDTYLSGQQVVDLIKADWVKEVPDDQD